MDNDIYVVMTEYDMKITPENSKRGKPIICEMYADNATKENAQKFIDRLNGSYGNCKIAKLQFQDTDINNKNHISKIEKQRSDFEEWWIKTGSGIIPTENDDFESHSKQVALQAWIQNN